MAGTNYTDPTDFGQWKSDNSGGPGFGLGDAVHAAYNPIYAPQQRLQQAQNSSLFSNSANLGGNIVGPNLAISSGLYGNAGQAGGVVGSNIGQQQQLVNSLGQVVAGTAPSVAQNQLTQGLGAIQAGQQSAAAGASGQNGALANMNAAQNMQAAQVQANQQAALIRAQEVAQARAQQAGVLANIGGEAGQSQGQNLQAAGVAGNTAAGANQEMSKEESARTAANKNLAFGGLQGLGGILGLAA
jgi:hypothetical protein